MYRVAFVALVFAMSVGCGQEEVTNPGATSSDGSTTGPGSASDGGASLPGVGPVSAHELYELSSPSELAEQLRNDTRRPVYEPPEIDAPWVKRVKAAFREAELTVPVRARTVETAGGALDVIATASPRAEAPWVTIERWQGQSGQVLEKRAALYTTPIHRTGFHVDAIDVAGVRGYRSNLDDPKRPTFAWLYGGLFVKLGHSDVAKAADLHVALLRAGVYGEQSAPPSPAPVAPQNETSRESQPSVPREITPDVSQPAEEPVIREEEIADHPEDDELPFGETFGKSEGHAGGPTAANGSTGGGREASGAFAGRARAGDRTDPTSRTLADAVDDALHWLAAHQSPDGKWAAAGFDRWCYGKPKREATFSGEGKAVYDVGVTGLALQAFLGAGYTHRGRHPFAKAVSHGLRYLKSVQDKDGCFGPRTAPKYIYNHAAAALAMVEAYGMTNSAIYKGAAQRALDFCALARNPYFVWRYGVKPGDNDTSVTGAMFLPLHAATLINATARRKGRAEPLTVDATAGDGVRAWSKKVIDPDYGRAGYNQRGAGPSRPGSLARRFPGDKSESMTGVTVLLQILLGEDPRTSRLVRLGANLMRKLPPRWNPRDGSIDMIYWYWGTLAMYQVGGKPWETWKIGVQRAIVGTQLKDTDYCRDKGSWDPIGLWGEDGGRVMSTALLALCCEAHYRYGRVFEGK